MRLPVKTKWGNEVILAEEEWMTLSELNFNNPGVGTDRGKVDYDILYYIDEGMAEFEISGSTLQWGYGKSVRINAGTTHSITPVSTPLRVIKVSKCKSALERKLI
jgi:mannose-6-phosphate isomerase-like protein (cupin superfamily)